MGMNTRKYTSWKPYELKSGKSAGRIQARFYYKDPKITEKGKNPWRFKSMLIPKECKSKAAQKKWGNAKLIEFNEREIESIIQSPDTQNDSRTIDEMVRNYLDFQLSHGLIDEGSHYRQLSHYDKHISPIIGEIGFLSLDRNDLIDLVTKLFNSGLSQSSIYHYVKIVRKTYNYYQSIGDIDRNPFDSYKLPKPKRGIRKSHLTQEQTNELLNAIEEEFDPYSPMQVGIYLAFYCGLRRGEICGLRWRNINFDNGWITIDTAIGTSKGKQWTKQPKGDKERTFPINPSLLEYLKGMKAAKDPEPTFFVLTCTNKFYSPHVFTKHFTDFRKQYNLRDAYDNALIPHGIRHNLASVGIRAGMDMSALSNMFGHSSIAMTTDVYGDTSMMGKVVGAQKLAQQFEKEQQQN